MERKKWIDVCKGVGILAVAMGHMLLSTRQYRVETVLMYIIYSFHMPFFFYLSGLNLKCNKESKIFITNKFKTIFVPYLSLCVIDFIIMSIGNGKNYYEQISFWDTVFMTVESAFSKFWFLIVLMTSIFIIYVMEQMVKYEKIKVMLIILMPIINRIFYYNNIQLPLSLEVCLLAIPFIYIGYLKKDNIDTSWKKLCFWLMLYSICFAIHIVLKYPIISVYDSNISNVILYVFEGISACFVGVIGIQKAVECKHLKKIWDILAELGKESLYIYGFHYYFLGIWQKIFGGNIETLTKFEKYTYDFIGMVFAVMLSFSIIKIVRCIKVYYIRSYIK